MSHFVQLDQLVLLMLQLVVLQQAQLVQLLVQLVVLQQAQLVELLVQLVVLQQALLQKFHLRHLAVVAAGGAAAGIAAEVPFAPSGAVVAAGGAAAGIAADPSAAGASFRHGGSSCCCCCSSSSCCCCICIASIYCQYCCICRPWSLDCCWCSRLMTILQRVSKKNKTLAIKKRRFCTSLFYMSQTETPHGLINSSIGDSRELLAVESKFPMALFLQQSRDFTPCSNLACAELCSNKN